MKRFIITAMPLPKVKNDYNLDKVNKWDGYTVIDKRLTQENVDKIEQENPNLEYLNHGMNGIAYSIGNHVLKITRDKQEAILAEKLINEPCECIVQVFGVKQLQSDIWQLELEKVIPLNQNQIDIVHYLNMYANKLGLRDIDLIVANLKQTRINAPSKNKLLTLYDKYKRLVECALVNDFHLGELHGGNIGFRENGQMVILDLGVSSY